MSQTITLKLSDTDAALLSEFPRKKVKVLVNYLGLKAEA